MAIKVTNRKNGRVVLELADSRDATRFLVGLANYMSDQAAKAKPGDLLDRAYFESEAADLMSAWMHVRIEA